MKHSFLFYILLLATFTKGNNETNNVCKTFLDYYTDRDSNRNCYYNPDIYMTAAQIIERHGYPVETYNVTTEDNYILTLFRIPHEKNGNNKESKVPILIQHGVEQSSIQFVNTGRKSLAFILADNGYDVWLGNFRGSVYSNMHVSFNNNAKKYWNFSFHEHGVYDLPVQLNFILNKTQEKIIYIGYSMGTTAYFVYNSEFPDIARERIKFAINLAPVMYLHNLNPLILKNLESITSFVESLKYIFKWVIGRRNTKSVAKREKECLPDPLKINICDTLINSILGYDCSQQDMETLPITAMQNWDSISTKTIMHYLQIIKSKRFQRFDYKKNNMEIYGSPLPLVYNTTEISVPNYFIWGNGDILASEKNVKESYSALPEQAKKFGMFKVPYAKFNHLHFVNAKDIVELLYNHILQFLKENKDKYI